MRKALYIYLLLVIILGLSSCVSGDLTPIADSNITASAFPTATTKPATMTPTMTMTLTETPLPTPMAIPPTATYTPLPTHTATLTPLPTLEPTQAEETIRTFLRESTDCSAPCFWGIVPGQTTFAEAQNIFTHLGLQRGYLSTEADKKFYAINYELESGLSIGPLLTVQDDVVENLTVDITPETYQTGVLREWLAYSPETLITRYGTPSRVDFFLNRGPGPDVYAMQMYFDEVYLIIQYGSADVEPIYVGEKLLFRTCLLTGEISFIRIWLGEDPENPPGLGGIPIEDASGLTLDEFAELMTGDPEDACIELKNEAFP